MIINRLDEEENKKLEQTEKNLQNLFDEKLQLQNVKAGRAHRVGDREKSYKITIIAKFESFKENKRFFQKP